MIEFGREYYVDNKYFFLKKRKDSIDVYYSVSNTLSEARQYDEMVKVPLVMEDTIKIVVEKALKSKKKFSKADLKKIMDKISSKEEIGELVDFDGTFNNSKIPIHDPKMSPTKTMDQTVFSVSQPGNPWTRGYRVYYGESIEEIQPISEIDAAGAFGFEETEGEGENAKEAIETFKELGVDDPIGRAEELGYDPKLDKKKLPGSFTRKRLEEIQKEKMIKVLEDILTKKSKDTDVQSKKSKTIDDLPLLIRKNVKTLLKHMNSNGITKDELINILKNEQ
jgi:hypothetical protein